MDFHKVYHLLLTFPNQSMVNNAQLVLSDRKYNQLVIMDLEEKHHNLEIAQRSQLLLHLDVPGQPNLYSIYPGHWCVKSMSSD